MKSPIHCRCRLKGASSVGTSSSGFAASAVTSPRSASDSRELGRALIDAQLERPRRTWTVKSPRGPVMEVDMQTTPALRAGVPRALAEFPYLSHRHCGHTT